MSETVIIPPEGRRVRGGGRFIPPLLIAPWLLYHVPAWFLFGSQPGGWSQQLVTIPMVSGVSWSFSWSDLWLLIGLGCLFVEVLKSTNTGRNSIFEHMMSTAVFVAMLVEFLLYAPAASSTFFILMAMALVDVVAGFTISITGAGRDVTMAN